MVMRRWWCVDCEIDGVWRTGRVDAAAMITRTRAFNDAPTKPGPDVIVTHQWDTFALFLSAQGQHTPATICQVPDVLFSRCGGSLPAEPIPSWASMPNWWWIPVTLNQEMEFGWVSGSDCLNISEDVVQRWCLWGNGAREIFAWTWKKLGTKTIPTDVSWLRDVNKQSGFILDVVRARSVEVVFVQPMFWRRKCKSKVVGELT